VVGKPRKRSSFVRTKAQRDLRSPGTQNLPRPWSSSNVRGFCNQVASAMNASTQTTADASRYSRLRLVAWLVAWLVAGLVLVILSTHISKLFLMMVPLWLASTPGALTRFNFITCGILSGYAVMLGPTFIFVSSYPSTHYYRGSYRMLIFGCLGGLVVAVSRRGLGPDSRTSSPNNVHDIGIGVSRLLDLSYSHSISRFYSETAKFARQGTDSEPTTVPSFDACHGLPCPLVKQPTVNRSY
jgi:membrane protein implicated in regulation of membrane protease activity